MSGEPPAGAGAEVRALVLDLDGTVYRGNVEVPGAAAFVRTCGERGIRCLFATNRATRTPEAVRDQLLGFGIPCGTDDILTTAECAAELLPRGSSAYLIGEEGLRRAMAARGVRETADRPDAVVVSLDRRLTYDMITTAMRAVRAGARYLATNLDKVIPLDDGIVPSAGAVAAAVTAAADRVPELVGKPGRALIDMALRRAGAAPDEALVVGDNLLTDIGAGAAAGVRTVLLLTGVSRREEIPSAPVRPTYVAEGYDELGRIVFGGR